MLFSTEELIFLELPLSDLLIDPDVDDADEYIPTVWILSDLSEEKK